MFSKCWPAGEGGLYKKSTIKTMRIPTTKMLSTFITPKRSNSTQIKLFKPIKIEIMREFVILELVAPQNKSFEAAMGNHVFDDTPWNRAFG
jgi:hypothetical protein